MTTVGLLHPGLMGVSVGAALLAADVPNRVIWDSSGRSDATRERASQAGLLERSSLSELLRESQLVISVCPPAAAQAQAEAVAKCGFQGCYLDANAVSPQTARAIMATVEARGADYIDGAIIGPPATRPRTTRLYLSGAKASPAAGLFRGSAFVANVIDGPPGAASAVKMCYAAVTKGSSALLLAVRALAAAEGVNEALLAEWEISQAGLAERSAAAAPANAAKAWRFVGEMDEIAASFAAHGLPDGFHRGAAELYQALSSFKDAQQAPDLEQVIAELLRRR